MAHLSTNGTTPTHMDEEIDQLYAWFPGAVPALPPLPEAPASVNCHITVAGRQVQLTLRDTDETRLLERLQAVLERYPVPAPPAPAPTLAEGWCAVHQTQMKDNVKDGRHWWSHQVDGRWCKGR